MNNYERYSSRQLYDAANTGPENLRSYLIGLLMQREDRDPYIREVLASSDRELLRAGLRSLSPSDAVRFGSALEGLLSTGDQDIRRTIVKKWGEAREKTAIPFLLTLIDNVNEDPLLKKMAIFSLGEIGGEAAISPLSALFGEKDADTKIAILIALNKIDREGSHPLFIRASTDRSPDVRHWAEEFLKSLPPAPVKDDHSITRTWMRDPLAWPDRDRLSFLSNGEGVYEEDKAGETTLLLNFRYRLETSRQIVILSRGDSEYATGYTISNDIFHHPYEGKIPCLTLEFADKKIAIDGIVLTGTPYYFLAKESTNNG